MKRRLPAMSPTALQRRRQALLVLLALLGGTLLLYLPQQRAPAIRIGVLHSLTGTMAVSERPLVDAIRLAVDELNAEGGLLGRQIEMQVVDGRSDWTVFAGEADRLIGEQQVAALFACWTSACRREVRPVVERHNHLMFYPVQYEGIEQSPNLLYTGAVPNQQIIPGTHWAMATFGKRVYLLGSDYVFPRTAHHIMRDLVDAAGGTVTGERYLPLGSTDVAAIVDDIRRLQPDVVLNTINGDSNLPFFRALRQAGLNALPVVSFSLAEAELQSMGHAAFHPAHYAIWHYFQSLPDATNLRFVDAFKARFGRDRVTSDPVWSAYIAVHLWAGAVRDAGTVQVGEVNRALGRQSIAAPGGPVAVDAVSRHIWRSVRVGKARADGQFEQVGTLALQMRPVPFPAYRNREDWLAMLRAAASANARP